MLSTKNLTDSTQLIKASPYKYTDIILGLELTSSALPFSTDIKPVVKVKLSPDKYTHIILGLASLPFATPFSSSTMPLVECKVLHTNILIWRQGRNYHSLLSFPHTHVRAKKKKKLGKK